MVANINFKSQLQGIKDIKERNEKFYTLSLEDRRREIAYDQLQLIIAGKLRAANGMYWSIALRYSANCLGTAQELQDHLIELPYDSCAVCQRGGIMISRIRLGNKIEPQTEGLSRGSNVYGSIIEEFDYQHLRRMEREYEESEFNHPYLHNTEEKMANICCNIIHNGYFNIEDTYNYLSKY